MTFFMNAANMMIEVHVLLVANDVVTLLETSKLLEFNSYKVTAVRVAAIASSLLAKEKVKYDVVMVDVSSSDVQGFQLAHDAINLGYTVILMSDNPNPMLVKCAIEDGAFMFIQKPASMDVLKYLWQHVLRENARKSKENARFSREMMESSNFIFNSGRNVMNFHPNNIEPDVNVHQELGPRNMMYPYGSEGFDFGSEGRDTVDYRSKKPKICTEWTEELHEKFVEAVKELGEGRCFPRDILELMNVPGLKRMQVASHLQKCRQGWKQDGSVASTSSNPNAVHPKPRRRGSYPRVAKGAQPKFLDRNKEKDEQAPPTNVVEDSTSSPEPADNMRQNRVEISDNASNNIANVNETISRDNILNGETSMVNPSEDAFNFARDNFGGSMNQMDYYNFEGFGLDQIFPQNICGDDEENGSFWRSFLSNF